MPILAVWDIRELLHAARTLVMLRKFKFLEWEIITLKPKFFAVTPCYPPDLEHEPISGLLQAFLSHVSGSRHTCSTAFPWSFHGVKFPECGAKSPLPSSAYVWRHVGLNLRRPYPASWFKMPAFWVSAWTHSILTEIFLCAVFIRPGWDQDNETMASLFHVIPHSLFTNHPIILP